MLTSPAFPITSLCTALLTPYSEGALSSVGISAAYNMCNLASEYCCLKSPSYIALTQYISRSVLEENEENVWFLLVPGASLSLLRHVVLSRLARLHPSPPLSLLEYFPLLRILTELTFFTFSLLL